MDNETITSANVIGLCVRNCQQRKKLSLAERPYKNVGTWVNNLSFRPLSTEKYNALKKRLNFSLREAPTKEHLAELECALKIWGFPEDTKSKLRQTIVSKMFRARPISCISGMEQALRTARKDKNIIILPDKSQFGQHRSN